MHDVFEGPLHGGREECWTGCPVGALQLTKWLSTKHSTLYTQFPPRGGVGGGEVAAPTSGCIFRACFLEDGL